MTDSSQLLLAQQINENPPSFTDDELKKLHKVLRDPRFQDAMTYREQVYYLVLHELLKGHNIEILKIPEHSSNQVQRLDIVGFNLLKS